MTTTDPLDALLVIRSGDAFTSRWNFLYAGGTPVDGVGHPTVTPYGIGQAVDLTYSFPTQKPAYSYPDSITGVVGFSTTQQQAAQAVMAGIAEMIGVTFTAASSGNGMITLAMNDQTGSGGYAYPPVFGYSYSAGAIVAGTIVPQGYGGDVWLNNLKPVGASEVPWTAADFAPNGYGYGTLIHELGHALGLKHPFEPDYVLDNSLDNTAYTVMSYTPHPYSLYRTVDGGGNVSWDTIQPETLMPFDIVALQYLYGAKLTTRTGNDTYTFATDRPFIKTIWDGGGSDTISVANFTLGCTIDLRAGYFSSISIPSDPLPAWLPTDPYGGIYDGTANLAIANGVTIEMAIGGSGNDQLTGNNAANTLDGQGGNDTMTGGSGNDTYIFDNSGDTIVESADQGTDTVKASIACTLGANLEKLILTGTGTINGTGNGRSNTLTGNTAANRLSGLNGNDVLGGGDGDDSLDGGNGVDRLEGGSGADRLEGGSGNDTLNGGDGADSLYSGPGDDSLSGGNDNDTYFVESPADLIIENLNAGSDTVKSTSSTFTLGDNVERLILTGSGSIAGTGNGLNNTLTGNSGSNTLSGLNGNDTLAGGSGNDTLYGGSGLDRVAGGAGTDIFVFDTVLNATTNVDTITDFSATDDTMWLEHDIFTNINLGALAAAAFYSGAGAQAATTPSERIVYNITNGALFYDADGVDGASAVKIAVLGATTHPQNVTAADFWVV